MRQGTVMRDSAVVLGGNVTLRNFVAIDVLYRTVLRSASKVMNSIHVVLAALLSIIACFAQGQVYFANRVGLNGSILNAPVTIQGTQEGPGPNWSVQLLLQSADGSLTPLIPISTFNPAGPGAAAISSQFWAPKTVDIPGHFAGEALNFVVQAWLTSQGSYDAAKAAGAGYTRSDPFTVVIGGLSSDPNAPPVTPANLTSLKAFSYVLIPEPSTITIGLLGAALVIFRRRNNKSQGHNQGRVGEVV